MESRTATPSSAPPPYDFPAAWYSSAAEATTPSVTSAATAAAAKALPRAYPLGPPMPPSPAPQEREEASAATEVPTPKQTSAATTTTTSTQEQKPKPARRSFRALRPRKAAMTLSPDAVRELRRLLDLPEPKLIKVGVKQKGCSGLAYDLEYVDKPGALDEVVEQDGVKLVIDNRALMSVIGSEMHWQEDMLSQKFVFRNPNISEFSISLSPSFSFSLLS